jgi:biotin operon repressor
MNFKLEGINKKILEAISSEDSISQAKIADYLKMSRQRINQHIKTLTKKGLLTKKGTYYFLTNAGALIVKVSPVGMDNHIAKPIYFRVHDIALSLKLKDTIEPASKQVLIASSRLVPMQNHIDLVLQAEGYKARLYPNSLTIILPDMVLPLTADLELATTAIMDRLEQIVPMLEARLGIKVIRLDKDTLRASLVNMHIALTNHQFAETINDKGEKLYVYDDNNVLRVIVDKSHGLDEFEAIAPAYVVEDAGALGKLTKATIQHQFDYKHEQELVRGLIEVSANNTQAIHEERQWFRHHDELTVALTKYFNIKIKEEKIKENTKQRRL